MVQFFFMATWFNMVIRALEVIQCNNKSKAAVAIQISIITHNPETRVENEGHSNRYLYRVDYRKNW
jgi:hypothetical protein